MDLQRVEKIFVSYEGDEELTLLEHSLLLLCGPVFVHLVIFIIVMQQYKVRRGHKGFDYKRYEKVSSRALTYLLELNHLYRNPVHACITR